MTPMRAVSFAVATVSFLATVSAQAPSPPSSSVLGLDFFASRTAKVNNPIRPFTFPTGEIPLDLDPRPELFDEARVAQTAEAINLGLREMVRAGRNETEIRAAFDKVAGWAKRVDRLRTQSRAGGIDALEALASRSRDIRVLARAATRWVEMVELERANILIDFSPIARSELNTMVQARVDAATNQWRFPPIAPYPPRPSAAFARAAGAVERALAVAPGDPEARLASASLLQRQYGVDKFAVVAAAKAAVGSGQEAVAARLLVLDLDTGGPYQLKMRANALREVQRAPSVGAQTTRTARPGEQLAANERVEGTTVITSGWAEGPIIHSPTAQELAQADALDAEAARTQAAVRAATDALLRQNPRNALLFQTLAYHSGGISTERILQYALYLNPGDYRLHWLRGVRLALAKRWDIGQASDYAQWLLRNRHAPNVEVCAAHVGRMMTMFKDPFAQYTIARYCAQLAPAHPVGHLRVAQNLPGLIAPNFLSTEVPNAATESLLEADLTYQLAARIVNHPEEWVDDDDKQSFTVYMALAQVLRGQCFEYLRRLPEAIAAFEQALALNPQLDDARQALRRLQPNGGGRRR